MQFSVAFLSMSLLYNIALSLSKELYNVYKERHYGWSFADSFFVAHINSDAVMKRSGQARSFVECCTTCDVWTGCKAVAYSADNECFIMNAAVNRDEKNERGGYQVMVFSTEPQQQVCHEKIIRFEGVGLVDKKKQEDRRKRYSEVLI